MSDLRKELLAHRPDGPSAIAFGVFDGVHRGHRHVVRALVDAARERGLAPVVVTLANHPLSVLRPDAPLRLLTPTDERLALLRDAGPVDVAPFTFTRAVSQLSAREFMTVLRDALRVEHFVAGADFALGRNREGDMAALAAIGEELGYTVETVGQHLLDGAPVRSTAVRAALADGDVALARRLLGRPFAVGGPVVAGDGVGAGVLGYPTANIGVDEQQALPADGVYAARLRVGGSVLPAAASVGAKPTFVDDGPTVVEAFVLDFTGNLYGARAKLEFAQRLRGQEKFATVDELIARIDGDVADTRRALADDTGEDD